MKTGSSTLVYSSAYNPSKLRLNTYIPLESSQWGDMRTIPVRFYTSDASASAAVRSLAPTMGFCSLNFDGTVDPMVSSIPKLVLGRLIVL
jgi:hypothetical protein